MTAAWIQFLGETFLYGAGYGCILLAVVGGIIAGFKKRNKR